MAYEHVRRTDEEIAKELVAEVLVFQDSRFAVTGGYYENLDGLNYLAFGQLFFGQYSTFGRPQDSLNAQRKQNQILEKMQSTGLDVSVLRTATEGGVPFVQGYCTACGDGQCAGKENICSCPEDCGPHCANWVCEAGEDRSSCPADC